MTDNSQNNPGPVNPNEAIAQAEESAKNTSSRNLPDFNDLPIPEDTANLRLGPNLHDGLLALLPLIGVWRGQGQAAQPGEEEFTFGQQVVFAHALGHLLGEGGGHDLARVGGAAVLD